MVFSVHLCPGSIDGEPYAGIHLSGNSAAEFALLVDFCGGWHTPNTIAIPSRWNMAGAQFHRVCLVLSA